MRTLVLGGSVFVGKRLVEILAGEGHDVTVLNRGKTPTRFPDGVAHLAADRTDGSSMRAALGNASWDAVFDVSGFVMAAGGSDIEGLLELLDGQVGSYVFVSSIMAYDQSLNGILPWSEDMADNPDGPSTYGGFKALAEQAILRRAAKTGFPGAAVRPAAIYGPDNNIFDMETPMFLRLEQGRPILLPHSGLVSASYGHVDDLCELMISLAGQPAAATGQIFNVTAEAVTTRRYVETLAGIVGTDPHIVEVPDGFQGPVGAPLWSHLFGVRHHGVLSIDKAQRLLGYSPRYDFVAGHEQTYRWFKSQGWSGRTDPLSDPVWKATWDFAAESAAVRELR